VGTFRNYGGGGAQGSQSKPIGCSASRAYALGPDDEEEGWVCWFNTLCPAGPAALSGWHVCKYLGLDRYLIIRLLDDRYS
jgi:hypothetical protein